MKVVPNAPSEEVLASNPIFNGTVHTRPLIDAATSPAVTVTMVRFSDGGRTKRHTHTADQLLYIVEGQGIVATDDHENHVRPGDIVHVPAGEVHWHGAEAGADMAHLSILPPCQTSVLD